MRLNKLSYLAIVLIAINLWGCYKPPSLIEVSNLSEDKSTDGWERHTFANYYNYSSDEYEDSDLNFEPASIAEVKTMPDGEVIILVGDNYSGDYQLYRMQKGTPEPLYIRTIDENYGKPFFSPTGKLIYDEVEILNSSYSYGYNYNSNEYIVEESIEGNSENFISYYKRYVYPNDSIQKYFNDYYYNPITIQDNSGKYWIKYSYSVYEQKTDPDENDESLFRQTDFDIDFSDPMVSGQSIYFNDYDSLVKLLDGNWTTLPSAPNTLDKLQETADALYGLGNNGDLYKFSANQWTQHTTPAADEYGSSYIDNFYVDSKSQLWVINNNGLFVQIDGNWIDRGKYIEAEYNNNSQSYIFEFDGYLYFMFSDKLYRTNNY